MFHPQRGHAHRTGPALPAETSRDVDAGTIHLRREHVLSGRCIYPDGTPVRALSLAARLAEPAPGGGYRPVDPAPGDPAGILDGSVKVLLAVDDVTSVPLLHAGGTFLGSHTGDSFFARWQSCIDGEPPLLDCPTGIRKVDGFGSAPGEVVTFWVGVTDETDPSPVVVCTPPSGSFVSPGTTTVNCTATDAAGNQSSCSFPVTVESRTRRRY